jgi:hypothetical protein
VVNFDEPVEVESATMDESPDIPSEPAENSRDAIIGDEEKEETTPQSDIDEGTGKDFAEEDIAQVPVSHEGMYGALNTLMNCRGVR